MGDIYKACEAKDNAYKGIHKLERDSQEYKDRIKIIRECENKLEEFIYEVHGHCFFEIDEYKFCLIH
jgi:hypothetical protein